MDLAIEPSATQSPTETGSERWERWWRDHQSGAFRAILIVAVLPTLVSGFVGAGYISDDYWIAMLFDDLGVVESVQRIAFSEPARPLAAPYYWFMYHVVGNVPLAHVTALTVVNLVMVHSLRSLGRQFLAPHIVLPALLLFAALPNHSTTRLWFVVATYPLAVAIVAWATILLIRGRQSSAAVAMACALFLYEGVGGFALAMTALVAWRFRSCLRPCLVVAVVTIGASFVMYVLSPKASAQQVGSYPGPFEFASTLLPAQLGSGLAHFWTLSLFVFGAALVVVILAAVRLLPSFGRVDTLDKVALVGVALLAAGAGPMLVGGSYFGADGLNDRNNLVPSVGASLILGAAVVGVGKRRSFAGIVLLFGAVAGFSLASLHDVAGFRQSLTEGGVFEAAVVGAIGDPGRLEGTTIVINPLPASVRGTTVFVNDVDIQGALQLHRGGDWGFVHLDQRLICGTTGEVLLLDWRSRDLRPVPDGFC